MICQKFKRLNKSITAEWMMRYKNIDHPVRVGKLKCCRLLTVSPKAPDVNGTMRELILSKYPDKILFSPSGGTVIKHI